MAAAEADVLGPAEIDADWMLPADGAAIHVDGVEHGAEAAIHGILRQGLETTNIFMKMRFLLC